MQATQGLKVEVRLDAGDGKGKGLFATGPIARGDLLFAESPLVAIQHSDNSPRALACAHCFQVVGGVQAQLDHRRVHQDGRNGSSDASTSGALLPCCNEFSALPVVPCTSQCGKLYCSEACRDAAWTRHHSLLCAGLVGDDGAQPLADFYQHAEEYNDVFILAAQVVATALLAAQHELGQPPDASTPASACWAALLKGWQPFAMGHKGLWWECVAKPDDVHASEEAEFRACKAAGRAK